MTVLGIIVVIRILLSFSLEVEIDGFWPWNRWRDTHGVESATSLLRTDSVNPALSIPIEDPRVADDSADQSV